MPWASFRGRVALIAIRKYNAFLNYPMQTIFEAVAVLIKNSC